MHILLHLSVGFMVLFIVSGASLVFGVYGYTNKPAIYHIFFSCWIIISALIALVAIFLAYFFASGYDSTQVPSRPYYYASSSSSASSDEEDPNEF